MRHPSLTFTLPPGVPKFGPRVGRVTLTRDGAGDASTSTAGTGRMLITMDTPNILVGTSRGVVPHLSRDHTHGSDAIQWLHVPFESFLEQTPPIPTLQNGPHPLHRFLGFDKDRHIASLSLRDPLDMREMPPNGNTYVSANCVRGVKKVTLSDWRRYVYDMQPDVVFALTDTPFTPPPYSQKRVTKSIERSTAWVADIIRSIPSDAGASEPHTPRLSRHPLNVLVHMAGGTSLPAREAFAHGLRERLHGPEADAVKPLRCLDEGITGYVFDLAVLRGIKPSPNTSQRQSMPDDFLRLERPEMLEHPESIAGAPTPRMTEEVGLTASGVLSISELSVQPDITSMLKASLGGLSEQKPRLVTGIRSPHEILRLIRDVGIDIFDVAWAMNAANLGVALDFVFPVPASNAGDARQSLGHNLYGPIYKHQFGCIADMFVGAGESADEGAMGRQACPCIACSPRAPSSPILHSTVDMQSHATSMTGGEATTRYEKPYSRAYIHHLLHTHEMSAHALLMAHNLAVVSAFLAGVRRIWAETEDEGRSARFAVEVERFSDTYEESGGLFIAAKKDWEYVDKARGKGRLAREREKQEDDKDE
ncbi:hypothetical protein EV363DRAFT_1182359 [Boletus edulis]|nr:hypothetical protein EV363DRAFT_1182359 [Boletus edulis]